MIDVNPTYRQLENQPFKLKPVTAFSSTGQMLNDKQKLSKIVSWHWGCY